MELLASMVPLTLGMSIDFYLVARVTTDAAVASEFAAVLFAVFAGLWFVAPRLWRGEARARQPAGLAMPRGHSPRSW